MRLGAYPCRLAEGQLRAAGLRRSRDQRTAPPPLRIQSRIRRTLDRTRPAAHRARRRTASTWRSARLPGSSLVSRLPVPSGIQVEAAGAASVVRGLSSARRYKHRANRSRVARPHSAAADAEAVRTRRLSILDDSGRQVTSRIKAPPGSDRRTMRDRKRRARARLWRDAIRNRCCRPVHLQSVL